MSYILDALKRADAERERGAAPGLHTRHQVAAGSPATPSTSRALWLALAGGMALLMLGLGVWLWRATGTPPAAPVQPVAITAPASAVASAPITVSPPPAPATPIAPATVAVIEAPKVRVLPVEKPAAVKATVSPPSRAAAPASAAVSAPPATPVSRPVAVAAPAAVPLQGELPQDIRSQIPKITITGSVFSDNPAQRLLLVNNLVLAQGGQITPDLTVEEIQPRSSVFSFKGTRFRVMH